MCAGATHFAQINDANLWEPGPVADEFIVRGVDRFDLFDLYRGQIEHTDAGERSAHGLNRRTGTKAVMVAISIPMSSILRHGLGGSKDMALLAAASVA